MHNMIEDQLEDITKSKDYAEKLVWTESWANTFSNIAQHLYKNEYSGVSFNSIIVYNGYNFENPTIGENSYAFQELAVTALLWDLYDNPSISGIIETHDNISLSTQIWWNVTTANGLYTLSEFMEVIEESHSSYLDEIGSILSMHQISPGDISITNIQSVSKNIAPVVKWRRNGSINNPNTVFQVKIYDAYNNVLSLCEWQLDIYSAYDAYMEFQIPLDIWQQAIEYYVGNYEIKIAVTAWNHISEPMTGPYPSTFVSFTFNQPSEDLTFIASSRYLERKVRLDKGQHYDFNVTFLTAGTKLFQTFGTKDTKLELYASDGTLLASNDDGGYGLNALISYEVQASMQYTVRVKFYSAQAYGTTKLAIIPARYLKSHDSETINSYEAIYHVQNALPVEFGAYTEQDYVMIFRYIVPTSGDYTFTITSDFDTYMYVIDPRSSELLVVNVNYNDDSGEGLNPLITTHLDAGVPYLIIFSAYNPHNPTVAGSPTLTISITEA